MIFKYKAITPSGQMVEGFQEAPSQADVVAMLKGNNNTILSVERDIESDSRVELFSKKVKKKDLAVFCRQFYTMIDAGLGIVKCLDILGIQTESKPLRAAIISVNEDVQKGLILSEAMKNHPKIFPTILISMVGAGEVSGNLDAIMERMAVHFEKENKIEAKIKSSMIYPMVLAIVSVVVVIFMLVAVLPTFIGMFEGSGTALPGPTQILLDLSASLRTYWYAYGVVSGFLIAGIIVFKNSKEGTYFFDGLKLKIPVLKTTVAKIVTSRFTRTLSTLMAAGIPLIQAMEVVAKVVDNAVVEERLLKSIESIRKGIPLSRAVKQVDIYPPMVDSMIKIGEESGALDDILFKTADFYDQEVDEAITRATSLIEPLMIVLMAVMIGFIVIAMYLPMFDIMSTI